VTTPRFHHLNVVWELFEDWADAESVREALEACEAILVRLGIADRFIFVATTYGDKIAMKHKDRVIVVQTQDETHLVPDYIEDVFMVFKTYRPFVPAPANLRVIPLGCNKDVAALPPKAMEARTADVFFIGRVEHRDAFLKATLPLNERHDIHAHIAVGPAYRQGIAPEEYARTLVNTKIALAPRGVSHETFRLYEAMRAGCVVIAERQLPTWFNDGWPVIEVDGWDDISQRIDRLLADAARLKELSARGQAWWREKCSPAVVGRYMAREIVGRLTATAAS
jgi:hypothetical protein